MTQRAESEWGWSPANLDQSSNIFDNADAPASISRASGLYSSPSLQYPQPTKPTSLSSIRPSSQSLTTSGISSGWQRTSIPAAPSSFTSNGGAGIGRISATAVVDPRAAELRAQLAQLDARIENLQSSKNWNLHTASLESHANDTSKLRKFAGGLIGAASTLNGASDAFSNGYIGDTEELSAVSLARYSSLMPLSVARKAEAVQNDNLSYSLQSHGSGVTSVLVSPFKGQTEPFTSSAIKSSSSSNLSSRKAIRATQARMDLVRVIFLRANRDRIIKAIRRWVKRSTAKRQLKAISKKEAHARALKRAKELLRGACCRFLFRKKKKMLMLSKSKEELAQEIKNEEEHWKISSKFDRRLDAAIAKHAASRSNEDYFQYDLLRHSSIAASVYNSTAARFAPLSLLPDQNVVLAATAASSNAASLMSLAIASERYEAAVTEAVKDRAKALMKQVDDTVLPDFVTKPLPLTAARSQKAISPVIHEKHGGLLSKIISHRVEPKPGKPTPSSKTPSAASTSSSSNISSLSKQLRERQSPDKHRSGNSNMSSPSGLSIVLSNAVPGVSQLPIPPLPLSLAFSHEDERKSAMEQIAAAEEILSLPSSSFSSSPYLSSSSSSAFPGSSADLSVSYASKNKMSTVDADLVSKLRSGIAAAVLLTPLNKDPPSPNNAGSSLTKELGHSGYLNEMLASISKKNSSQQQNAGERELNLGSPKQSTFGDQKQQQMTLSDATSPSMLLSPKAPSRKAPSAPKGADAVNGLIEKVLDELDF